MGVGDDIIKQQLFFRKELRERVYWFIRLRWGAAGAGIAAIALAWSFGMDLPYKPLLIVVLAIAAYNLVFYGIGRRLTDAGPEEYHSFEIFAHAQVLFDLAALFFLVFLTGGMAGPLPIFFIFHVILAGILLSPLSCYIYAILIVSGVGALTVMQSGKITDPSLLEPGYTQNLLLSYITFSAGIIIAAYLMTSVKRALRFKGRELMKVSRDLDRTNAKLTLLYEMIKEVNSHSRLQKLMNSAVENAAGIMGVKACSIKLMDNINNCLRFAATYGLSEDYLSKGCVSLDESAVNRRILEGSLYSIARIDETNAFQYPENIRKEGIASMLCLPLKVDEKILGVFCVYSPEADHFDQADADFFSLMTDLTALAIGDRIRDNAKTWFLNKAAHHMRSPLNTIQSMLHVIVQGYLGEVAPEQKETLSRCLSRLRQQQDVINDLLKLAAGRQEAVAPALGHVSAGLVLGALEQFFKNQALTKGLQLKFDIPDDLPMVMGQEKLLDEIFTNLVSNAVKYTPPGGRVDAALSEFSPETILLEIRDTGIGIPEKAVPTLFSEFFRAENARDMVEEGTGLGMVIVKEALDLIKGRIEVNSQVGKGTTIRCYFPIADRPRDKVARTDNTGPE